MATQYTPILQLALPVTGELNGTWGDVVNDNITSMVEEAIAGLATISTWTANAHTLTTVDGLTDEARCAMLVLQTGAGGTALTGAGQAICPARTKLYVVKNDSAYAVTVKTAAGTGVSIPSGDTGFVFCDGANVLPCLTQIVNGHITGNLTVDGNTTLGDASGDTVTINAGTTTVKTGGAIRLEDNAGGEYVALKAPATLSSTYTLTLPIDDGTNGQALITDGSGNLSWSSAASGDVYGPASATSTAVALFDGTTGKLLKNSVVTIDGTGNILGALSLDLTTLEVTNIKAKDGTSVLTLADTTGIVTFNTTNAVQIPKGTAPEQPGSPTTGMIRYNTTSNEFEGYSGASPSWKSIGGSAIVNDTSTSTYEYPLFAAATTGTAQNVYTSNSNLLYKPSTGELQSKILTANTPFVNTYATVQADYTTPASYNTMSVGPVTVNSGVTVTVTAGTVWAII